MREVAVLRGAIVACLIGLAGCVTPRVRTEAHLALQCPEAQIQLTAKGPGTWEAVGCGRLAVCNLPDIDGAEVSCAGGGAISPNR
jgi:hypothetical protein